MDAVSLGERITLLRKSAGLSQQDLAACVGISPQMVSKCKADKVAYNFLKTSKADLSGITVI